VRVAMLDRMWHMTKDFTENFAEEFFNDQGLTYRMQMFATARAQHLMALKEFDILFYYEGDGIPGFVLPKNRIFDVYVAAVGLQGDKRLKGLPQNASAFTAAMIKGDDFRRYIPTIRDIYRIEHVEQAFAMLNRGRVSLLTEYATYHQGLLKVPGLDPDKHKAVQLAGPKYVRPMFHDTEKGNRLCALMDAWLYEKHQKRQLRLLYNVDLLKASYPKEFIEPKEKALQD